MLRHLVNLSERLEKEDRLLPLGYRDFSADIDWVLEVDGTVGHLREASISDPRPNRKRTSGIRPLLLADYAYYVLGVAEEGKEERAEKAHEAFIDLLEEAAQETGDEDLQDGVDVLRGDSVEEETLDQVDPRDIVTLATSEGELLFNRSSVQDFWGEFVAEAFTAEETGTCSVCGDTKPLLRTLPEDVSLLGETPQITSFNLSAFESYGRKQTLNASLCFRCGARAAQALNYLTGSDRHRVQLARDPGEGGRATLRDQLAVFWTTAEKVETEDGRPVDVEAVLAGTLGGYGDEDDETPDEAEVEDLLKVPWHVREAAIRSGEAGVHLLVLSPNRGRLVVRDWLHESLERFRQNLQAFLQAVRVVGPWGEEPRPFSVRSLLDGLAVRGIDPETGRAQSRREVQANEVRGLLRTAYSGHAPPTSLAPAATRSLRSPAVWDAGWLNQRLIALLKFSEVTSQQEGATMTEPDRLEQLEDDHTHPGYLCGRLLAVLESAQRRASEGQLNTTLVDRNYNAAATAPASTIPRLLNRAETAHIPKIRRRHGASSADWVRRDIEEILDRIEPMNGFPKTLNSAGQGQFALGFYHQRAETRRAIREHYDDEAETAETEEMTS